MSQRIEYLNHASMRIDLGSVRLLCDPWFWGTAFSGGWGLRFHNPEAMERAAECTHLWISHWHSDHLHRPTLEELARRNPDIVVLANVSANFDMTEYMRGVGFSRIVPLYERRPVQVGDVELTRFPTAGVDNMLVMRAGGRTLLNYNDCNLPSAAVRSLMAKIGRVDLLLTNYNHAGKLFDCDDDLTRRDRLWTVLRATVDAVDPAQVVPFASNHVYRCRYTLDQNASLLSKEDLERRAADDPRFLILPVGGRARLQGGRLVADASVPSQVTALVPDVHDYGDSVGWDELCAVVEKRCLSLDRRFLRTGAAWPELRVHVVDLGRTLALRVGRPPHEVDGAAAHIKAESAALVDWFGRPFGDDTFIAGAHFGVVDSDTRAIRTWALLTLLDASHLAPRHLLGYTLHGEGRRFLYNRREEIFATVVGARFRAGDMRL